MYKTITTTLLLILPLLVATPSEAKHRRSPSANHAHVHVAERHSRDHSRYIAHQRSLPSIENRMAKKHVGRIPAKRGADASQCRPRTSSSAPSSSTQSVSSVASNSAVQSPTTTSSSAQATTTWEAQYAAPTSTSTWSSSAAATTTAASSGSSSGLTPNGIKAGISAGNGFDSFQNYIGHWYDWTPMPSGHSGAPVAVSMLWGAGVSGDPEDAPRLAEFWGLSGTFLPYVMGFEEPDCYGSGSSGIDVGTAAALWNNAVVPHGNAGSILIGPSMCKQAAESGWYAPFLSQVTRQPDVTNLHINKKDAAGIQEDLDHYWSTYGKPMWITEFACVDDSNGFVPCTDQGEINSFIQTAVGIFESDSRVVAYAISQGSGLASNWALTTDGTTLSETGQTYLNAIKGY